MSFNLASPFSPFPSFVFGTGLTFVGLLGFARPLAIYAKSARDLATGALFILLETYQEGSGNEDAVTALLAVTACVAFADWWIVRRMGGNREKEKGGSGLVHLASGVVLGAFAMWRVFY